jgi:hypothetical protein
MDQRTRLMNCCWRIWKLNRLGWILVLLMLASPAWAARKITVQQLQELLVSLQQAKKSDADVATALNQIELSEELTRNTMSNMISYVPGPLSTAQVYILEAESAMLAPPATDLPSGAAPDAAAQKAILDKAVDYASKTYARLPYLTASKTTLRFQDNIGAVADCSGLVGCMGKPANVSLGLPSHASFLHFIRSSETQVASDHGVEKLTHEKDKTRWGANKMIELFEPDPSLSAVLQEAQATGSIQWLRWELVNGKQAAVYSFKVRKKDSQMAVDVCCFPDVTRTGVARFYNSMDASIIAGSEAAPGGSGGVVGNFQTDTYWLHYKATVPYHGELFIGPDSGIVVRMITEAEFKVSEVVHQIDTRIDYGPVAVDGKLLVLPVRTILNTEVVPNGDSGVGKYTTRRTLFTSEYKDYQPAAAH